MAKGDSKPPEMAMSANVPMWQQASNAKFADQFGPMINQFRQPVGNMNPTLGTPMPLGLAGDIGKNMYLPGNSGLPPGIQPNSAMGGTNGFAPPMGNQGGMQLPGAGGMQAPQPMPGAAGLMNPQIMNLIMAMQQSGIKNPGNPVMDQGGMNMPNPTLGPGMQAPREAPQFQPPSGTGGMFPQMMGRRIMNNG